MASEVIKLNLIPKGEMPVFHASQFDNGRLITIELYRGEDAYTVPEGYTIELLCRKRDNNIVTLASTLINDNVVTFTTTTQLTACHGKNLCEVAVKAADDYLIGTLNFYLEVEKDPLEGGINSTSQIHDLHDQIEDITEEIISDNYYDKTEVDELLSAKADSDSVYTIGEVNSLLSGKANTSDVYTKSQTDTLLSAKASITYVDGEISAVDAVLIDMQTDIDRKADASDVYTKSQVDTALAAKADAAATTAALATKADKSDTYTKEQVDAIIYNIFPVKTVSGAVASFSTGLTYPLVSVTADAGATNVTACGVNLWNEEWEVGTIRTDTGVNNNTGERIRSKGYIHITPSTTYFLAYGGTVPAGAFANIVFYDENKTYLGESTYIYKNLNNNSPFTSPANAYYARFVVEDFTTVYSNNISFNSDASTTYKAYNGTTVLKADATTLITQAGVNNVFADVGNVTVQYKYMSI